MINEYAILDKLTEIIGPSGFEKDVQTYFAELMKPLVTQIKFDKIGSCYAELEGDSSLPRLMFQAHADTIGFIVKYIDDKGFLFTADLNGCIEADYRMLPGTDVVIVSRKTGKKIPGHFIPTIPIHKLTAEELNESHLRCDLAIDIGASSNVQARRYVSVGDYVVIDNHRRYNTLSKHCIGTNLDDRLGLFCMYRIAKALKRSKFKKHCPVVFVSTVSEEVGEGAARVIVENAKPDISITIDLEVATDQIVSDANVAVAKQYGDIGIGKGVVITRGAGINDELFLLLEKICKSHSKTASKIPYQVSTDAAMTENIYIQAAGKGVKTALISIPSRNMHTRIETVSLKDVENTIKLSLALCKKINKGKLC